MSYQDKIFSQPPSSLTVTAEPWDTAAHMSPNPAWTTEQQLAWFSASGLVLALNASELCRRKAAAEGDKAAAKKGIQP